MSKGSISQKNAEMAKHLPPAPNSWSGCGKQDVLAAKKVGNAWKGRYSSTWERGMLGGVLANKLGFNMPENSGV